MTNPATRTGEESTIRAIVFKEGDLYIAQCLEYDICVQGATISALLDRLDLTVEAEFDTCRSVGKSPRELICQAPNYYHTLWEQRSVQLERISIRAPGNSSADPVSAYDLNVAVAELPQAA